jgi:hypothetical protein
MDVLLTVDCVTAALFAGFCLAKVIPACNRSMFRFRLWKLRDELADEIRAGVFHDSARARELMVLTEDVIERAAEVSAGRLLLLHAAARGRLHYLTEAAIGLEGLDEHDLPLLTARCRTLEWVMRRHVMFGSPVGWLLLATLVPLSLLAAIVFYVFDRSGSVIGKAKALLRKEIDPRATLLDRSRPLVPERELSHMV